MMSMLNGSSKWGTVNEDMSWVQLRDAILLKVMLECSVGMVRNV